MVDQNAEMYIRNQRNAEAAKRTGLFVYGNLITRNTRRNGTERAFYQQRSNHGQNEKRGVKQQLRAKTNMKQTKKGYAQNIQPAKADEQGRKRTHPMSADPDEKPPQL